jgi:hypothetical protein
VNRALARTLTLTLTLSLGLASGCSGCRDHASKLDPAAAPTIGVTSPAAWPTLEARAAALEPPGPSTALDGALDAFARAPADLGPITQGLLSWFDAHGGLPAPAARPIDESPHAFQLYKLGQAVLEGHPDDDRVVEAVLALARRMRRDGHNLIAVTMGLSLATRVTALRHAAPPFAARYRPEDAEVRRAFAVEAIAIRASATWSTSDDGKRAAAERTTGGHHEPLPSADDYAHAVEFLGHFGDAPTDRAPFLAFVKQLTTTTAAGRSKVVDRMLAILDREATRMFSEVDGYAHWLAVAPPPPPPGR